jgi:hypothetical protein
MRVKIRFVTTTAVSPRVFHGELPSVLHFQLSGGDILSENTTFIHFDPAKIRSRKSR